DVEPDIARAVAQVAALFEAGGAHVEPVAPFLTPELLDGLDLFWRVRSWSDYAALPPQRQALVLPYVRQWCLAGAATSGARVLECYQQIMRMQAATVAATEPHDIVVSPVAPVSAFAAEQPMPYPDDGRGMRHVGFTAPYNMSGQPAATVNCGFTADGRPIGVQISGRRFDDLGVLRAARWVEQHRPSAAVPCWPDHVTTEQPAPQVEA
ncbi:MAG: amidase family protein, partial [Terracoccus sp.]